MSTNKNEKVPGKIVEFQPDALEIKNQKLPFFIRFGVWFPLVAMIVAITWACLAKTDVVIQGGGKLVTDLPTIVMKPLERSVIKEIQVKIGDVIGITFGNRHVRVKVLAVPEFANKEQAALLYEELPAEE